MKNFKFSHLLLAVVGVLAFASCQHEHADWTPGPQDRTMGVYFPSIDTYEIKQETASISIPVMRVDAEKAAEVSFRWTVDPASAEKFFTTEKSVVSFEAGSEESVIEFAVDGTQLEMGKAYNLNIQLDQANASSYAISEATFEVIVPEPWVPYGATEEESTGIYFDDFLWNIVSGGEELQGYGVYVLFEKHGLDNNRIRAVDTFSPSSIANMWGFLPEWMNFTAEEGQKTYIEFNIANPDNVQLVGVEFPATKVGPAVGVPLYMWVDAGYDMYMVVTKEEPIKLVDGIINFPINGVDLGAIVDGAYYGTYGVANAAGELMYYLPGTEFANYGMAATYDGMYVSADGATAKAIFNFSLGADVASYKFAFAQGDVTADPSATVTAIVEGSEDIKVYESDIETTKFEVELTKGVYTLVAVPYTAEGEARTQDVYTLNFYFNGAGEMPKVEVDVEVGVPSQLVEPELAEELEKKSPACFSLGVKITADASQLKAIKYYVGEGAVVDAAIAAGKITIDELFAGNDASEWIEKIAEKGSVVGSFSVIPSSKLTLFLRFETIYGTNVDVRCEEYTVPKYDGDFPVGTYKFTEGKYEQIFSITPDKSYTTFIWHTFDKNEWRATYDPETKILSMGGSAYGYEAWMAEYDVDSLYGIVLQSNETTGISYMSKATADAKEMSAVQVQVGENGLEQLLTYYSCYNLALDAAAGQWGIVSAVFEFTPAATIAPYVEEQPEQPEQPEAQSLSATINAESYAVEAKRAERVEVVKPYYGEFKRNLAKATIQR